MNEEDIDSTDPHCVVGAAIMEFKSWQKLNHELTLIKQEKLNKALEDLK